MRETLEIEIAHLKAEIVLTARKLCAARNESLTERDRLRRDLLAAERLIHEGEAEPAESAFQEGEPAMAQAVLAARQLAEMQARAAPQSEKGAHLLPETPLVQVGRVTQLAPASVAAGTLQQQLQALASDVSLVRRAMEQISAKQDQMVEEIEKLHTLGQYLGDKLY